MPYVFISAWIWQMMATVCQEPLPVRCCFILSSWDPAEAAQSDHTPESVESLVWSSAVPRFFLCTVTLSPWVPLGYVYCWDSEHVLILLHGWMLQLPSYLLSSHQHELCSPSCPHPVLSSWRPLKTGTLQQMIISMQTKPWQSPTFGENLGSLQWKLTCNTCDSTRWLDFLYFWKLP